MTWSARQPFLWLLITILGLLVLLPADDGTAGGRLLAVGLLTAVYLAGFAVIYKERRHRAAGLLLGISALAAIWAEYLFGDLPRVPPPGATRAFPRASAARLASLRGR